MAKAELRARLKRLGRYKPLGRSRPALRYLLYPVTLFKRALSLTVSRNPYACMVTLQAAGAAWQVVDEADCETAADAGDRVRHVPLRPDRRRRAAGSRRVAQVPRAAAG